MIVPLSYFIEKPFQNWTRESTSLIGTVILFVDFTAPVERVRARALEIIKASPLWDGTVAKLQVTEATEGAIQLRILASARSSGDAFDLRCEIRERLIEFVQQEIPQALPRSRQEPIAPGTNPGAGQRDTSPTAP
jgi:small-conductance mechanosensitive channel